MTFFSATDRYLARIILVPLLSSLIIAAMLLVLDRMLRLFDFVAAEGGPVSVVWRMLANLLPEYLSLGIPIGLLMGILLGFRRIAISSELDVMQAVGLSYGRMLRVPYIYAAVLAAANLGIVGFVQPWARYQYEQLRYELRSGALGASIKVGEFNKLGKDMTLRIDASADQGRSLSGIFVNARTTSGKTLAVTAEHGQFLSTDDPDVILLRLSNGTLVHDAPGYRAPRILTFTAHDLPIDLPKLESFRKRGEKQIEQTLPDLVRTGGDRQQTKLVRDQARSNFYFRLIEVGLMFLLPLLAVALAVPPKRSSSALGVFLGIVLLVSYYKVNEYAQGLGGLGFVDPLIAIGIPFLLFSAFVARLYFVIAFVPGGQPIGALDRWAGKAVAALRKLVTRRP